MLQSLLNIFRIAELRNKLIFTVALLCVYRIGFYVTLPGIDAPSMRHALQDSSGSTSAFSLLSSYLTQFSGGDLTQGSIFGLGIMPYISASIIIQLLGTVVPSIEKLRKEGEPGVRKINEWTRYLTLAVCIIQAGMYAAHFLTDDGQKNLYTAVHDRIGLFVIMSVIVLTAGSVFLMWLGEQIDYFGIGNGVSLIITAGIVARMPMAVQEMIKYTSFNGSGGAPIHAGTIIFIIACFVLVVAGSILLTQAQRRIPVQQAKHMRGRRVYGGAKQYLPLRVNHAGVMPIIFASSLMVLPAVGIRWLWPNPDTATLAGQIENFFVRNFGNNSATYLYELLFCIMIFFFSYFWNTVQFQPKEMANQLRDYGSFIPGLRPGKRTADYLEAVMNRITYVGAGFLCVIAVIPSAISSILLKDVPQGWQIGNFLGGTGLLIVISVMLDLVIRIEANLVMRNYSGFTDGGNDTGGKNKRSRGTARTTAPAAPAAYNDGNAKGLPA